MQFEKDPASLKDSIERWSTASMWIKQVHRARAIEFDKEADEEVLGAPASRAS